MSIQDDYKNAEFVPNLLQIGNQAYITVPTDQTQLDVLGISTIDKSVQEVARVGLSAATPHLSVPSLYATNLNKLTQIGISTGGLDGVSQEGRLVFIDPGVFAYSVQNRYNEIIFKMLERWNESIKELAEQQRRELNSPAYLHWLDMKKAQAAPPPENKRQTAEPESYLNWAEKRYKNLLTFGHALSAFRADLLQNGPSAYTPVMAGLFAIGSSISDYSDRAVQKVAGAVEGIGKPLADMNLGSLLHLNTLFGSGVLYQSGNQIALNVGLHPDHELNRTYARQYAENLLGLVKSPEFNAILANVVTNEVRDGKQMSEGDKQELVNAMKFTLLMTALAVVDKSETDWITQEEISGMLTNKIPLEGDKLKTGLRDQIFGVLGGMGKLELPMVNATLAYLNTNPSFEELGDAYQVFKGIHETDELSTQVRSQASA